MMLLSDAFEVRVVHPADKNVAGNIFFSGVNAARVDSWMT